MDQGSWTNIVVQRPVMETRNPTPVLSPSGDPTHLPREPHGLLDDAKTGAVLVFSGMFLTLVGVSFTAMGWHHYRATPDFEWTQLLGPMLISVGGTFMLTSVCKFGVVSCWPCARWDKEVLVMPVMEQTSEGRSFTLSGTNQPIVLRNTTAMLCIPPQYNFITQGVHQTAEFQPGGSVNGVHASCPPYDAVCCVDNAAFTAAGEDVSAHCTETDHRRSRTEKTESDGGRGGATCSPPPAYEDIYPPVANTTGHKRLS